MVIADTSVWILFFNRPASQEKRVLDLLIDTDEVALIGVVLAELLQGCRSQVERDDLAESLLALPYLEVSQASWIKAGDLSSTLLQKGITLPLSDLVIAVLAMEHQCQVYSLDLHFRKIPGVQLYAPRSN